MQQEASHQRNRTIWYYDPGSRGRRRKCIHNHCKKLLYEILYRGVTRHRLEDIYFLVKLLPRSTVIDSYAMFRFIMILINTVDTDKIHKNFIIYLEASLSRYDLSKPDVFVEFLSYLIKNNRIGDARELFNLRHKYMSYQLHRPVLYNDVNIACYGFLLNYLSWQERLPNQEDANFDVSVQGWVVNGMEALKQVQHNYELFIMCITNVLLHYGFYKKAYLFVSEFQRVNPDNLTGHLLLFNLIKVLSNNGYKRRRTEEDECDAMETDEQEDARIEHRSVELNGINNFAPDEIGASFDPDRYPTSSDNKNILINLMRLDPRREEIMELSLTYHTKLETIQVLMDSLMEVPVMRDTSRWRSLQRLIDEIILSNEPDLIDGLANLWQTRYQQYWRLEDFIRIVRRDGADSPDHRVTRTSVIKRVIRNLKSRFDLDVPEEPEDDEPDLDTLYPLF